MSSPRGPSGYDIRMCAVRMCAGSMGCSDAVSAPFEYPCVGACKLSAGACKFQESVQGGVEAQKAVQVMDERERGEGGEATHDKCDLTHVAKSLERILHELA